MISLDGPIPPFEKAYSSKIICTCKPYPDQYIDQRQYICTALAIQFLTSNNEVPRMFNQRIVLLSDVRARVLISDFFLF